jgi:hypothetical protein
MGLELPQTFVAAGARKTLWNGTRKRPGLEIVGLDDGEGDAIVWGGNYFADLLPPSQGWLVWDKITANFSACRLRIGVDDF